MTLRDLSQIEAEASHGNTVDARGDCPVCGRKMVALTYQARNDRHVCANEFACFAAWKEAKGGMRTVIVDD